MDIPGNLGASSVPPLPSRGCPVSNNNNTNSTGNGAESKTMLMTAPRQQPLPALPASIQGGPMGAIGGGFPVANRNIIYSFRCLIILIDKKFHWLRRVGTK